MNASIKLRLSTAILLCVAGPVFTRAQSSTEIALKPAADIGIELNAAIAGLHGQAATIVLPSGSYNQSTPVLVSGTGIHIVGAKSGTVLNFNPQNYHVVDSADSKSGWSGSGVAVSTESAVGEDHPDPMEGSGYIAAATNGGSEHQVWKSIAKTDFASAPKIGIWVALNLTNAQQEIQFFVSDATRTAYWNLTPQTIYGTWKFFGLDSTKPSGTDGTMPEMRSIVKIGFRKLLPNAKYFFDAISLYKPVGTSITFTSCAQCSLENVTIHWIPASDSDSAIRADQNTRELVLNHVHTTGAANAIDFVGPSTGSVCKECVAEFASQNGISLLGSTTGNKLLSIEANRNVVGIFVSQTSSHNTISSPHCVRDNNAGIMIDGNDNQITDAHVDTWMTFGFVIAGGAHNSVNGISAHSAVGESAVQLIAGAANNTLSSINIQQSGGSGLDLGGGVKPQIMNTVSNVIVHRSGSSSWHGGPKGSSEGRGLCLCNANDNTISHLEIYDTGLGSTAKGVEGITLCCGSSNNKLDDVLVYHSRHEGITVWDAPGNQLRNVRLVGNGLQEGNGAGLRIENGGQRTVVENVCYWMNGGGGVRNVSKSSSVQNARQVKNLDPKARCE